jgi:ribosomal protein S18 acetylase RimI-like enzyme
MHYRTARLDDWPKIKELHLAVSREKNGIARWEHEVTEDYILDFMKKSLNHGLMIVAENPNNTEQLIAEIHASTPQIHVFNHLLSDLTIAVHPDFQGKRIGRTIFAIFLEEVSTNMPHIAKIELITRESNKRAIHLYQSLGFIIEGRLEMRIKTPEGNYEADIPMGWQNPTYEF